MILPRLFILETSAGLETVSVNLRTRLHYLLEGEVGAGLTWVQRASVALIVLSVVLAVVASEPLVMARYGPAIRTSSG